MDVDPRTANDVLDEVQVLDVREPHEWAAGHIEGALHIPMRQLESRVGELATDRRIVAVCRSGARSGRVAAALRAAGYDAANLEGGMQAWEEAGLPFVAEDGGSPRVA
jgi:rhodanese-related sulfurtransferase